MIAALSGPGSPPWAQGECDLSSLPPTANGRHKEGSVMALIPVCGSNISQQQDICVIEVGVNFKDR